jgi:hypothetical protein
MLGGDNVLGSATVGVKSLLSERGYFVLIICFSGHNDLILWVAVTVFIEK